MMGAGPRTGWLPPAIERDDRGYIHTGDEVHTLTAPGGSPAPLETSLPGVFAVGDVRAGSMKRVATAVGEGSTAIRIVHHYLANRGSEAEEAPRSGRSPSA